MPPQQASVTKLLSGPRRPAAFTSFLAKNPVGRIVERTIQAVGTGLAIDEGLYIFEVVCVSLGSCIWQHSFDWAARHALARRRI